MLLSKGCEYGLRAALHLASAPPGSYVASRSVSDDLGLPYSFFAKVVQTLTQADLLTSSRGVNGGVRLARPSEDIRLREIVEAIDGANIFHACVLGLPNCSDGRPCPLHDQWTTTRSRVRAMFDETTLAALAKRIETDNLRLADSPDASQAGER